MPAFGDHHLGGSANPFEESRPHMSAYTAQEIATLQSRLEKQLGPEYISSRSGPSGQKVHYISAEKCIALANEVFGFNGWSSSIQNIQVDFVEENPQTLKVSLGLSVIVRVTIRDGTYHEDIGYGHIENCRGKAAAFEKAKKEGTTDALKRALRNFGNVLGNCLYDKDYLSKVTKIKSIPTKFDENNLHRHGDFIKRENITANTTSSSSSSSSSNNGYQGNQSYSNNRPSMNSSSSRSVPITRTTVESMPPPIRLVGNNPSSSVTPSTNHQVEQQVPIKPDPGNEQFDDLMGLMGDLDDADFCVPEDGHPDEVVLPSNDNSPPPPLPAPVPTGNEPVGFFSARAVKELPESSIASDSVGQLPVPQGLHAFNPKAESPSIRKTPGVDHTSSKPLTRTLQHVPPQSLQQQEQQNSGIVGSAPISTATATTTSIGVGGQGSGGVNGNSAYVRPTFTSGNRGPGNLNPLESARRIGAPGGGASPLANRSMYKPPTMKRPLPQAESSPALPSPTAGTSNNGAGSNNIGSGGNSPVTSMSHMAGNKGLHSGRTAMSEVSNGENQGATANGVQSVPGEQDTKRLKTS